MKDINYLKNNNMELYGKFNLSLLDDPLAYNELRERIQPLFEKHVVKAGYLGNDPINNLFSIVLFPRQLVAENENSEILAMQDHFLDMFKVLESLPELN